MKLFQIISCAQNGRIFLNMSEAFGSSDEMMAQAVRYFLPPIAKAIEKRSQTPEGLISILEFLGARRYDRFLEDARIFGHNRVSEEGRRALLYLFNSEARVQKIIQNRTKVLHLDAGYLERLFPVIAIMALGAIEMRTRRPLGVILHRLNQSAATTTAPANPYLALAQYLKRQERELRDQRRGRLFNFLGFGASAPSRSQAAPQQAIFAS